MKVNMTPNPLDVVTIHASQGDTEARQWEFELHNNGELIDTSDVKEQLVFKAYKGGTEQLLPENTSTPTTSPFLGDIRYPQGLLADQEFLYRESPTEEDGLAKITDIKGNTLVWNQLINAIDGSGTIVEGVTYTTSDGVITLNGTPTRGDSILISTFSAKANHKYLLKGCASGGSPTKYQLFVSASNVAFPIGNRLQDFGGGKIATALGDEDGLQLRLYVYAETSPTFANTKFTPQIFDLTAMGLDSLTNAEILQWFANYFPLSYYSYNQGSLLSFNGIGLKTGGENLIDFSTLQIGKNWFKSSAVDRAIIEFAVEENKEYTISFDYSSNISNALIVYRTGWNTGQISNSSIGSAKEYTFTAPSTCRVVCIQFNARVNGFVLSSSDFYGFWNCALTDTFSTKALPVSTYFPNGMDGVGDDYDELTESKAYHRMTTITLDGTQEPSIVNWRATSSSVGVLFPYSLTNNKTFGDRTIPNVRATENVCSYYDSYDGTYDKSVALYTNTNYGIMLRLPDTSLTTKALVMSYLAQNPITICYPMATPTETSFTTASLVTENAEIPLSNEDGTLIGKCTEELSENPGFIDAKIKLADGDGECYSNKIQLHVERSPQ